MRDAPHVGATHFRAANQRQTAATLCSLLPILAPPSHRDARSWPIDCGLTKSSRLRLVGLNSPDKSMARKLLNSPALHQLGARMKTYTERKSSVIAENNGWSADFTEGYLKGEYSRRSSVKLSSYAMVGLDEYCRGLRAGYFERKSPLTARAQPQLSKEQAAHGGRAGAAAASSSTTRFKQGLAY